MKKIVSVLFVVLLTQGALAANATVGEVVKKDRTMAVTWNPLSLLGLTFSANYHLKLGEKVSLILPLELMYVGAGSSNSNNYSYLFGVSSGVGARFYFTGSPMDDGFFIQPGADIGYLKFGGSDKGSLILGGHARLGYSWVWDSGFMMDVGGGVQYIYLSNDTDAKAGAFQIHGVLPSLEFAIGYAW